MNKIYFQTRINLIYFLNLFSSTLSLHSTNAGLIKKKTEKTLFILKKSIVNTIDVIFVDVSAYFAKKKKKYCIYVLLSYLNLS